MADPKRKPINDVIAENLAYLMKHHATLKKQEALAEASGVAQTTISNYLRPSKRLKGAKGKEPSAKVTELALLAKALGVEAWELLREVSPKERMFFRQVEDAFHKATAPGLFE